MSDSECKIIDLTDMALTKRKLELGISHSIPKFGPTGKPVIFKVVRRGTVNTRVELSTGARPLLPNTVPHDVGDEVDLDFLNGLNYPEGLDFSREVKIIKAIIRKKITTKYTAYKGQFSEEDYRDWAYDCFFQFIQGGLYAKFDPSKVSSGSYLSFIGSAVNRFLIDNLIRRNKGVAEITMLSLDSPIGSNKDEGGVLIDFVASKFQLEAEVVQNLERQKLRRMYKAVAADLDYKLGTAKYTKMIEDFLSGKSDMSSYVSDVATFSEAFREKYDVEVLSDVEILSDGTNE